MRTTIAIIFARVVGQTAYLLLGLFMIHWLADYCEASQIKQATQLITHTVAPVTYELAWNPPPISEVVCSSPNLMQWSQLANLQPTWPSNYVISTTSTQMFYRVGVQCGTNLYFWNTNLVSTNQPQ